MTASPGVVDIKSGKKPKSPASETADPSPKVAPAPDVVNNAAPKSLKLPPDLRGNHDELLKACATPFPAVWDDGVTYVKALQPAAIAKVLTRVLHHDLTNAKAEFVFRKSIKTGDSPTLAKASKAGGKLKYFSNIDLIIEVNWDQWKNLSAERRIALMDHSLTHFTRGESSYEAVAYDVQEYGVIVRRWGFWTADVERFATSVIKAQQLDIFASPIVKASTDTVN